MKRIITVTIALALCLLIFTSCSKNNEMKTKITEAFEEETTNEQSITEKNTTPTTIAEVIMETTGAQTTESQIQEVNEYKEEQYKEVTFEMVEGWLKVENEDMAFLYEGEVGVAPFIMVRIDPLDATVNEGQSDIMWAGFVSGTGAEDYIMINTDHHDFAQYNFSQEINNDYYFANCASTYIGKNIYTIGIMYNENEPKSSYYDSVLDHVVKTTQIKLEDEEIDESASESPLHEFGSRKNPASMGAGLIISGSHYYGEYEYSLILSNPIRGKEALTLAKKWNRFNDPGDEEYLICDVEFELIKWDSPNDEKFTMSHFDFDYYTNDFNKYRPDEYIVVKDEFRVEAYEGAKVSGKLGLTIPKDDNGYIVCDDFAWWVID